MNYRRLYSHIKDKSKGVLFDQTILLNNHYASLDYPEKLRIVKFKDITTGNVLTFLTNNFYLKATYQYQITGIHHQEIESVKTPSRLV